MLKKFICQQSTWSIVMTIGAIMVTSAKCQSDRVKGKKRIAHIEEPFSESSTVPANPIDVHKKTDLNGSTESINSATSSSSGVSSGSEASSSVNSGFSGSYTSSYTPPPPPAPTDFAGLPNMGNTCYMNSVLQIIAAFYKDKVTYNGGLNNLIHKINTGNKPLDLSDIRQCIELFPGAAKKLANSGGQQDPDEFIMALDGDGFLHSIECAERLLFKIKTKENEQNIYQKELSSELKYGLSIGFNPKLTGQINLTELIASNREELVKDTGIEISSWADYLPYTEASSSFVTDHSSQLESQEGSRLKNYIKQQVINKNTIPSKLYVQLQRFSNANSKIKDHVHGAMHITIKPDPNRGNTVAFDLNGFIVHSGDNANSGHYVAYVKREGKWYKADDSVVTEMSEPEASEASKKAYLLFYKKQ